MGRETFYSDGRFRIVGGKDHAVGQFVQLFDSQANDPVSDDCIFDIDELFGISVNKVGVPTTLLRKDVKKFLMDYIEKENTLPAIIRIGGNISAAGGATVAGWQFEKSDKAPFKKSRKGKLLALYGWTLETLNAMVAHKSVTEMCVEIHSGKDTNYRILHLSDSKCVIEFYFQKKVAATITVHGMEYDQTEKLTDILAKEELFRIAIRRGYEKLKSLVKDKQS